MTGTPVFDTKRFCFLRLRITQSLMHLMGLGLRLLFGHIINLSNMKFILEKYKEVTDMRKTFYILNLVLHF